MVEKLDFQLVIAKMDDSSVEEIMQLFLADKINIIKPPQPGLLMMIARDSFDIDFCLGEILVTMAEVEYEGMKGYGMVIGDSLEKAIAAALVDAILQADERHLKGELKQKVKDIIAMQAKKILEKEEMERRLIAKTKVSFETMAKR